MYRAGRQALGGARELSGKAGPALPQFLTTRVPPPRVNGVGWVHLVEERTEVTAGWVGAVWGLLKGLLLGAEWRGAREGTSLKTLGRRVAAFSP